MEPWKSSEIQSLAMQFLDVERVAGRAYQVIVEDNPNDSSGRIGTLFLYFANPSQVLDWLDFLSRVTGFLKRNAPHGINGWVEPTELMNFFVMTVYRCVCDPPESAAKGA